MAPVEVGNMEGYYNAACNQETHEVSDHQATQEDEEGGAGAAMCPLEGFKQSHKGDEIGAEAQSAEGG